MTPTKQDIEQFYESQVLTDEEEKEAILEGKKKKYFRGKHRQFWEDMEKGKVISGLNHKK